MFFCAWPKLGDNPAKITSYAHADQAASQCLTKSPTSRSTNMHSTKAKLAVQLSQGQLALPACASVLQNAYETCQLRSTRPNLQLCRVS